MNILLNLVLFLLCSISYEVESQKFAIFTDQKQLILWQFHVARLIPSPTPHTHTLKNRYLFGTYVQSVTVAHIQGSPKCDNHPQKQERLLTSWHVPRLSKPGKQTCNMKFRNSIHEKISGWIIDTNRKGKTVKLLEENTRQTPFS